MASAAISRGEILYLYRSLLRTARQFCDYNIREYTKRRTIDAFRQNQNLTDSLAISAAYSDGKTQLDVAKRQAVVYSLYAPTIKSVMEAQSIWPCQRIPSNQFDFSLFFFILIEIIMLL